MIMLPLHSQYTAAIKRIIGQALPNKFALGDVFGKQASGMFAEFIRVIYLWFKTDQRL
jgi:hypothetical protein